MSILSAGRSIFAPARAGRWIGFCGVCCGFALVLLAPTAPLAAQEMTGLQAALALEKTLVDAIARSERSVVAIARGRKGQGERLRDPDHIPHEFGTGVVVDRGGLILTNYHVLGDVEKSEYAVWIDRKAYQAKVKGADPWADLAILEIEAESLQPIKFGNAATLKKGQIVISLGNPYAVARDGRPSATWGIVSNLSRKAGPISGPSSFKGGKETLHHFGTLIQTDARLNLGTSGGALLNLQGEMVGLTTSMAALAGYEKSAGFAIPVNDTFRRIVEQLKQGRPVAYGFLGVAPEPWQAADERENQSGVVLQDVVAGTPAARAGLRIGDVVTHIDQQALYQPDDLMRIIGTLPVDAIIRLTVVRRGQTVVRSAQLSKKRPTTYRKAIVTAELPSWRGMLVDYATAIPNFQRHALDVDPDGCVAIVEVERDSQAWKAGLRPAMFISHVEGVRVSNPREFFAAAAGRTGPVRVQMSALASADEKRLVRVVSP